MTVTSTSKIKLKQRNTFAKYAAARDLGCRQTMSAMFVLCPSQVSSLYCGSGDTNKGDGTGWVTPMNTRTVSIPF